MVMPLRHDRVLTAAVLLLAAAILLAAGPSHVEAARILLDTNKAATTDTKDGPVIDWLVSKFAPKTPPPQPATVPGQIAPGVAAGFQGSSLGWTPSGRGCWDPHTNAMLTHGSVRSCYAGGTRACDNGTWRFVGNCQLVQNPYSQAWQPQPQQGGGGFFNNPQPQVPQWQPPPPDTPEYAAPVGLGLVGGK